MPTNNNNNNTRFDDGNFQQRLDEVAYQRIQDLKRKQIYGQQPQTTQPLWTRQGGQQKPYDPVLDRVVSTVQKPIQESIEEKRAREYAERTYMRAPHYSPKHLSQRGLISEKVFDGRLINQAASNFQMNGNLNQYVNNVGDYVRKQFGPGDSAETYLAQLPASQRNMAITQISSLQNNASHYLKPNNGGVPSQKQPMLLKEQVPYQQQPQQNPTVTGYPQQMQPQQQQQSRYCKLHEGFPIFHALQTQGFGNSVPLVRAVGQTSAQMFNVDFVMKNYVRAFIVQPGQTVVNMKAIQENPSALNDFVEIQAPPMTGWGNFLVSKAAIIEQGQQNMQKQNNNGMLLDSIQRGNNNKVLLPPQRPQQQVQQPRLNPNLAFKGNQNKSGLLKG